MRESQSAAPAPAVEKRTARKSLFTTNGVRGVWLNELTRAKAAELAAAFASLLWEASPLGTPDRGHPGFDSGASLEGFPAVRPVPPVVVIGQDDRPSAPDIVTGAAAALRRMGCQVIDVGLSTRPCVWFAVNHLDAAGGLFVTGAECPPSWTGIDFVVRGGLPLSRGSTQFATADRTPGGQRAFTLDDLASRVGQPSSRPVRDALPQRTFQAHVPYEAGLLKHFHALRPLTVCCGCPVRMVRQTLERTFAVLPCRLRFVDVPSRARNVDDPTDADVLRMGDAVRQSAADLGVLIDDDAQRCGFVDEAGRLVPPPAMARLLAGILLSEHPRGAVVAGANAADKLRAAVERQSGRLVATENTLQAMSQAMRQEGAILGSSLDGRTWLRETYPTCDAVITLARALDLLSRSDRPLSEIARSGSEEHC